MKLKQKFKKTFQLSNKDINKFLFLLRKGVYPYEYIDNCERFDEYLLTEREDFNSNLNIKAIIDEHYAYEERNF